MTRVARLSLSLIVCALALTMSADAQQVAARGAVPSLAVVALNTTAASEPARPARNVVRPNDVLRYTLTFTNPTNRTLAHVELKNPMPAGVRFVSGSTHASRADARVEFSADGGKSWAEHPMESVLADGQAIARPIGAERFTHVRWLVGGKVAPKATVTADFEARVDGPSTGAAAH